MGLSDCAEGTGSTDIPDGSALAAVPLPDLGFSASGAFVFSLGLLLLSSCVGGRFASLSDHVIGGFAAGACSAALGLIVISALGVSR